MENSSANQLPEVDSLPDGFVESSAESLAPPTPTFEEKPRADDEDGNFSKSDSGCESLGVLESSESKSDKTEKLRTFPVLLSEKDGLDSPEQSTEAPNGGCLEERDGTVGMPKSVDSLSEASAQVVCARPPATSHGKEQVDGKYQSSGKSIKGALDPQATHLKETYSSEGTEILKSRKLETSEVKRKNAKRTFKSEREFLEFTLKYQQVLAERDAAIAVRDKLESLCRELQRQNKMLMDECKRVSTEGQNLRLDLSTKFHDAIKDVSNKLEEQKDESLSQLKENEM